MRASVRCAVAWLLCVCVRPAAAGPLEDYVKRPDPAYAWSLYDDSWGLFANYYFLRLQSQQWLDETQVDRPRWEHEIRVAQPRPFFCGDTARTSSVAILIISGGHNSPDGTFTRKVRPEAGLLARAFCRPIFEVRQVPNEPLVFSGEANPRKEDAIIAYSFDRFLRGATGDWPVQLAMVRAVVQAMTAIQAFSRTRDDIPDIDSFVLIGASKRGWTAWLTAAVDDRVRAIVPVSIDMPDLARQFPHHFGAYGQYAAALNDYKAFDIGCRMAGTRGRALMEIVDPIAYRDRLTMPKLILNSAGDQFFVADSWRFYYDRLAGSKRLRYTVNSDHKHGNAAVRHRLFLQVRNWLNDVLAGREPPGLLWHQVEDGSLVVQPSQAPRQVQVWSAENVQARDFRLETLGPAWQAQELRPDPDGLYRVRLEAPKRGWRAAVVEAVFGGEDSDDQQVYTTGVYVVPDTLPHALTVCAAPGRDAAASGR